ALELERGDDDAAQAVHHHALRAERRALLAAGDDERLPALAYPLHERRAVAAEVVEVGAGRVAGQVRAQLVGTVLGQEQQAAFGAEDPDDLVEGDPGQFARVQHRRGGQAHLLQRREPALVRAADRVAGEGRVRLAALAGREVHVELAPDRRRALLPAVLGRDHVGVLRLAARLRV